MPVELLHSLLTNTRSAFLIVVFFGGSIFVHELGHFLAARRRGLKVDRFSIGFGPAIWSRLGRDGVEYRLSWIPFGGYVALPQIVDLGPIEGKIRADAGALPPVSYASKMIVLVAGAAFNLLFAFALACVIWVAGQPESNMFETTRIGYVTPRLEMPDGSQIPSPAAEAGLRVGDVVRAVDHQNVSNWNDLREFLATSAGRDGKGNPRAVLTVERDGTPLDITVFPRLAGAEKSRAVGILPAFALIVHEVDPGSPAGKAGIEIGDEILRAGAMPLLNDMTLEDIMSRNRAEPVSLRLRRAGKELTLMIPARVATGPGADLGLAFSAGLHVVYPSPFVQIRDQVAMTFRMLWSLLNPHSDIGLSKMTGPIGIVHIFDVVAENQLREVLAFTILVNVSLAIFNLLPIPVLDGGQMVFATISRLRRRALPANFIMTTQGVFMVLIFSMFIYISYFDVRRWVSDVRSDRAAEAAMHK